jgi:hypothetical protein
MDLNWPATGLLLGLVGIAAFRRPLTRLIERTERVKDWLVAPKQASLPAPADQALPTRDAAQEQRGLEQLTQGFNSQLLLLQEEAIRRDLGGHGLTADGACEKVLLRHLAGTQIALHFEKIYASIYGSQLGVLRWLNSQAVGVHEQQLLPFFQQAAKEWPAIYQHTEFRSWLGFLAAQGLITESEESAAAGEEEDAFGLAITVLGREFLAYMVNGGRPDAYIG